MSNATSNLRREPIGKEGRAIHTPVDGGAHIYEGTLVSQLTATGMLVPGSTASSGPACGVAVHEVDNSAGTDGAKRCRIETDQVFAFACGTGDDACTEATLLGTVLYMLDDHTVSPQVAGQAAGLFEGMESDGKVRVFVTFQRSLLIDAT